MADTLREYLVALGFKIDAESLKRFTGVVSTIQANMVKIGAAVGLTSVGVELGVAAIARRLDDLYYVSQRSGATVDNLEALGFAAKQIGLSASGAQASLEGFQATIRSNPGYAALLRNIGVDTNQDSSKVYDDFLKKLISLGESRRYIALQYGALFGIDDKTLQNYANNQEVKDKALEEHLQTLKRYGVSEQKAAEEGVTFTRSLNSLQDRFKVLSEAIGLALMPEAEKFIRWLTDALDRVVAFEHEHHILAQTFTYVKHGVIEITKALAAAFGPATKDNLQNWFNVANEGLTSMRDLLAGIVHLLAGQWDDAWKSFGASSEHMANALKAAKDTVINNLANNGYTVPGGASATPGAPPKASELDAKRAEFVQYFTGQGWSRETAAAITANVEAESGFNPKSTSRDWRTGGHAGLAQWDADRQIKFYQRYGHGIFEGKDPLAEQKDYINWELTQGRYWAVGEKLENAPTMMDKTKLLGRHYEIYGTDEHPDLAQEEKRNNAATTITQTVTVNVAPGPTPDQQEALRRSWEDHISNLQRNNQAAP